MVSWLRKWKFVLLALKNVICPWHFETSSLIAHPVSGVSSQNCRSAWILMGVWGYLSCLGVSVLLGCISFMEWFLSVDSQPPAIVPPGNTANQLPQTSMSLIGGLGRVLASMKHSLYRWCTWTEFILYEHSHCTLLSEWAQSHCTLLSEVRWSGTWEMLHVCTLFLSKREDAFRSWAPGSCPIPADGNTGCPHTIGPTFLM